MWILLRLPVSLIPAFHVQKYTPISLRSDLRRRLLIILMKPPSDLATRRQMLWPRKPPSVEILSDFCHDLEASNCRLHCVRGRP